MANATMPAVKAMLGEGGAYTGASNKRSLISWLTSSNDADSDLLPELGELRDRAQDLYRNAPTARGAIKRLVTGAVGAGLIMRSTIDRKILNLSNDEALAWEDAAEREFYLWADSRECDFSRRMTFWQMQSLAYKSQKVRGDCVALLPYVPRDGVPYDLRVQLIEADRVSNPDHRPDDNKIAGGIERDDNGVPVAIHVQTVHPGSIYAGVAPKWDRIPIFGKNTGRRQVLHLMDFERIDQSRGEPALAPVIETLKQLTRYSAAELSAAVINAILTVFVKRPVEGENLTTGQRFEYTPEQKAAWENRGNIVLGSGTAIEGAPGEELQTVAATRPNAQFDPFFMACLKQIGMALSIPFEVLVQHFQSSYSASRAALLEFAKAMKEERAWFISNYDQLIYEEFITEAVLKGRLNAPGFLDDPIIRSAYCQAEWIGASVGQVDPVKEATAARLRIDGRLSTYGREVAELTGADFEQVAYLLQKELRLLKELGLQPVAATPVEKNNPEAEAA